MEFAQLLAAASTEEINFIMQILKDVGLFKEASKTTTCKYL